MNVTVLGATGTIGREIARELTRRGTRSSGSRGCPPTIAADVTDVAALAQVIRGLTPSYLPSVHPRQTCFEQHLQTGRVALDPGVARTLNSVLAQPSPFLGAGPVLACDLTTMQSG